MNNPVDATLQALKNPVLFQGHHNATSPMLCVVKNQEGQRSLGITNRKELGFLGRIWTWLGFGNASRKNVVAFMNSNEGIKQLSAFSSDQKTEIFPKIRIFDLKAECTLSKNVLALFKAQMKPPSVLEMEGSILKPLHFWKIEGPGGTVSHLLGTVHLGIALRQTHTSVKEVFKQCDAFAAESAVNFAAKDVLSTREWRQCKKKIREDIENIQSDQDLSDEVLDNMTPRQIIKLLTHSEIPSLDDDLFDAAKTFKKPITLLDETVPKTEAYNRNVIQEDLLLAIKNPKELKKKYDLVNSRLALTSAKDSYESDKVQNMYEKDDTPKGEWKGSSDKNVAERNKTWIVHITPLIEAGNALITCGAAHLYGKSGVIALLKAKGYTITQMPA